MQTDPKHRGNSEPGFGSPQPDRRLSELAERFHEHDVLGKSAYQFFADPFRATTFQKQKFSADNPLTVGMIVHALPYFGWYKLQLGNGAGWLPACQLSCDAGKVPLGPKAGHSLPPYSRVLCAIPPGSPYAIILGVIPFLITDPSSIVPGWIQQGGQTGYKHLAAHLALFKNTSGAGIYDFSDNCPVDATAFEWSRITETGIGFLLDSYQAYVRVNEACGLFLNYWDSHCRLAGVQLDIHSAFHELQARLDEGETRFVERIATYPWEALGVMMAGVAVAAEYDDADIQYRLPRGKWDLPQGQEDRQGIYRVQRHDGYLGQGGLRTVSVPVSSEPTRQASGEMLDEGVFAESIGLDGAYVLRSAKSIVIGKRGGIAVPLELKASEDPEGDDAAAANYDFSGVGGTHKIGEQLVAAEAGSAFRAAITPDIVAYETNWKAIHPFHYHHNDYEVPEETDGAFDRINDLLDFSILSFQAFLPDPSAVQIQVDHRYQAVNYYQRESAMVFHEDGSIVLDDGFGARIHLGGGKVRIESPGEIELVAGGRLVAIARETILKNQGSVDITSNGDLRLKCGGNLQACSEGGILLDAKGDASLQLYRDLIGEDVVSAGIVLRSNGQCGVLAREVYIRSGFNPTGGEDLAGDITLDVGPDKSNDIVLRATKAHVFTVDGVDFWSAPAVGETVLSHRLGGDGAIIGGPVTVRGDVTVQDGSIAASGDIFALKNIAAGRRIADSQGGEISQVDGQYNDTIESLMSEADAIMNQHLQDGDAAQVTKLDETWYAEDRLGNRELSAAIGFSFRDDDLGEQYRTAGIQFAEPRWQQMVRLGGAVGGEVFEETPITYQGRELYPWPGRAKWLGDGEDGVFLRLSSLRLYDPVAGASLPRSSPEYETPTLNDWEKLPMGEALAFIP